MNNSNVRQSISDATLLSFDEGNKVIANAGEQVGGQGSQERQSILVAPEQVLPTLLRDGKRKWITPSLERGPKWNQRRWTAYGLIAFFVALPHLRIGGKPYVLLDIASREFTFLGHTFYPTDTPLLALLTLFALGSIMLLTSVAGRIWCGWGCPHTVYLEYLFRPIDRFFEGTAGKGGKPRKQPTGPMKIARLLVYLACSLFLAHTFLGYFVSTDELARWIVTPPYKHPLAFLVMAGTTLAMMFHFLYFREQLCFIACPYGRLQSVMLDRRSLIVAYDTNRGEPRKKGKRTSAPEKSNSDAGLPILPATNRVGDCIDCGRCTAVCPTGIDIRNGLQLECIHCTQCIDACNAVMDKVGLPRDLILYSSQDQLDGQSKGGMGGIVRPRTLIYVVFLTIVGTLFTVALMSKFAFDARVLPSGGGAPFIVNANQTVQNNLRLRIVNRSQKPQSYAVAAVSPDVQLNVSDERIDELQPGDSVRIPIELVFPVRLTSGKGQLKTQVRIVDSDGSERLLDFKLLGPR